MKKLLTVILFLFPLPLLAYQKGISLGLYSKDPSYSYRQDLEELKKTGATHVSFVVSWYQKNVYSADIYPRLRSKGHVVGDYETVADEKLIEAIEQAHQLGLKIMIFPILRLEERKEQEWRGSVSPLHPDSWFENFKRFTLHYARIAATTKVEVFSIGSELCSMEGKTHFWKQMIREIRSFYSGELLYSANWDHYKKIEFWDDLDYLGLNGYYSLTRSHVPELKELSEKWSSIEKNFETWQRQRGKKILFTEIGYPSVDGACRWPWDYTRDAPIDLEEQALCYEAFFQSWDKSEKLGGVYIWNWYGQGGTADRSYTPRGKPAEKVLMKWYQNDFYSSSPAPSSSPIAAQPAPISLQGKIP